MAEEVFTTSIIVQARPDDFPSVQASLESLPYTQVAHQEVSAGKFIILLEVESLRQIESWINEARHIDGVLSVTMVYQHVGNKSSLNEVIA